MLSPGRSQMHEQNQPQGQYPLLEIKTPPAVLAPIYSIAREMRGMLAFPLAFFGGLFGTVAITAGSLFAIWWFENNAEARTTRPRKTRSSCSSSSPAR
jgi:hypothetical protein